MLFERLDEVGLLQFGFSALLGIVSLLEIRSFSKEWSPSFGGCWLDSIEIQKLLELAFSLAHLPSEIELK